MENNTLPCSTSKPEWRTKTNSSNRCFAEMKPLEEVDKSLVKKTNNNNNEFTQEDIIKD